MNTPKATRAGRMNAQPVGFDLPVRTPACLDTGAGCGGVVGVSMVVTCRRSSTSSQPGLDDGVLDFLGGLLGRGRAVDHRYHAGGDRFQRALAEQDVRSAFAVE